ncbi:hypothetical protein ACVHYJ_17585 [Burkholderia pyrrocinia]
MKSTRKLEQLAALRRRRAERQLKSILGSLLEAQTLRACLEEEGQALARHQKAWEDALVTGNVIRGGSDRRQEVPHVRVAWIAAHVQAHGVQRHAHAQEIDRLEACKTECLREIGKQDALQSLASRRRRMEVNQLLVAHEDEDADEFQSRGHCTQRPI